MSKLFWAMLSFITRLPVPRRWSQGLDFEHYSRGIITFPLIGLLLGAISGLVFMVLQAWCGAPLAALFSVLVLAPFPCSATHNHRLVFPQPSGHGGY